MLAIGLTVRAQDSSNQQHSQGSAKQQAPDSRPVSAFLSDYSGLVPDANNGNLLLYVKDVTVLRKYNKLIFGPVTIYLLPEAQGRGIDPSDLERLAEYFHDAVSDELKKSGHYEIVTTPGPDVFELDLAITNVEPTRRKRNAAVQGGAAVATLGVAPGASLLVPRLSVGRVGIEGEILNSVTGERLVAFVTSRGGRRWFSGFNAFRKWGDIQRAFRSWAKELRERLDKVHGE